jgi:signal transduction histidine kinase
VQEIDRRHIASELHDEIGQILTGLKLTLAVNGQAPYEQNGASLAKAQALIDDLIKKVRGLSLDLRPSMLDDLGLLPTLLWYVDRYTSMTGITIDFHHQGVEGHRFDTQVETAAYRIVQEALTNVARHARVSEAAVQVWCTPDAVFLEIQDTGAGFNVEDALRAGKSIGLTGMRERASLLGGDLHIESISGAGTCIVAELPAITTHKATINL